MSNLQESSREVKVQMNEMSRVLAASLPDRNIPIGERAAKQQQAFTERIKKEAEEKQRREIIEATHTPQIDKGSSRLVQKRQGATDAMGRLTDEYLRKRDEAKEKLKR